MKDQITTHWTSDPALVEDFVLGRVEEPRRSQLADHLRTCEKCRMAVEQERVVASAARAYGRAEFRMRLKTKLVSRTAWSIPWPHIVSAAAVVLIVVGLGLYQRWFMETQIEMGEKELPAAPEESRAQPGPADLAGRGTGGEARRPEEDRRARSVTRPREISTDDTAERERTKILMDERAAEKADVQDAEEAFKDKKDRGAREEGGVLAEKQWIEGIVLEEVVKDVRGQPPVATQKQLRLEAAPATGVTQQQKASNLGSYVIVHDDARQNINLIQQSYGQMPAEQKNKEAAPSPNKVPTLLERTANGLNFTVYSDELSQEGQDVRVSPVTLDSLVVNIGGKKIGFRVPGGWGQRNSLEKGK